MDIYLIRHAIAEDRGPDVVDEDRALTEKGRERLVAVVTGLNDLGVTFDRILTSPWRRAAESAEILAGLGDAPVEATPSLAEPPDPDFLRGLAGDDDAGQSVALVGHEPWMSETLAWLVTGDPADADAFVMKKAGLAWLSGEPRPAGMVLRALIPPKFFRRLT